MKFKKYFSSYLECPMTSNFCPFCSIHYRFRDKHFFQIICHLTSNIHVIPICCLFFSYCFSLTVFEITILKMYSTIIAIGQTIGHQMVSFGLIKNLFHRSDGQYHKVAPWQFLEGSSKNKVCRPFQLIIRTVTVQTSDA